MSKSTATRLGQILLEKGLITAEQLNIGISEQRRRRELLDPFDNNLGVATSLGEILIELGFISRLQLKRGLNWQLAVRKMAIVMSFCAPLMTLGYSATAAAGSFRPSFTTSTASSVAPKVTPGFTKTSSSASSAPAISSSIPKLVSSSSSSKSSALSSSKSSANASSQGTIALKMSEISVVAALHDVVGLKWAAASGESTVGYKIYRDQILIDTVDKYTFDYYDFNVAADKTYLFGISVGDTSGNWSPVKSIFVKTAVAPVEEKVSESSSSSTISSVASSATSVSSTPAVSSKSSVSSPSQVSSSKASSSAASSKAPTSSASSGNSVSVASSSKSSAKSSVASSSSFSSAASSATSSSSSSVKTSNVAGPVSLNWSAPALREDGSFLDITEVGGYELRYRKDVDPDFIYVTINDAWKNNHNFTWLEGNYIFQIAAYDKNGLYSTFIDLSPQ